MARVAKPDTPIVVVDERLDPSRAQSLYHRLMYRLVTFYESNPRPPASLVPPGAVGVLDDQLERFFYCLTFRMPAPEAETAAEDASVSPATPPAPPSSRARLRRRRRRP